MVSLFIDNSLIARNIFQMKGLKDALKDIVPINFKSSTSILAILISIIIGGFLARLGEWLFEKLLLLINNIHFLGFVNVVWNFKLSFSVGEIIIAILFIFLFIIVYKYSYRLIQKKSKRLVILRETFNSSNTWQLNYWGSRKPNKTNRVENSQMIFEALPNDVENPDGNFGALLDIQHGIYEGYKYEIQCKVRSTPKTSMCFQLWIHDGLKGEPKILEPIVPMTPSESFQVIKAQYLATSSNAIRIHLHCKAGQGKLIVSEVLVLKI